MAGLRAGLDLLLVGYAGTAGTEQILSERPEEIRKRFGKSYLREEIVNLMTLPRIRFQKNGLSLSHLYLFSEGGKPVPEGESDLQAKKNAGEIYLGDAENAIPGLYEKYGIYKIKEVEKGGALAALWDFLEEESVSSEGKKLSKPLGCEFRYERIALRSITLELCELFDLNPYRLLSENCYLLAAERGYALKEALSSVGIHSEILGETVEGRARVRVDGKERSFLQKSHKDELEKLAESRKIEYT